MSIVRSPLIWVISTVFLLMTLLITTQKPPSIGSEFRMGGGSCITRTSLPAMGFEAVYVSKHTKGTPRNEMGLGFRGLEVKGLGLRVYIGA